jgi:UTP:GlnB (protein PII) uridylyltransferase
MTLFSHALSKNLKGYVYTSEVDVCHYKSKALTGMFEPKKKETKGGLRKLHNYEL